MLHDHKNLGGLRSIKLLSQAKRILDTMEPIDEEERQIGSLLSNNSPDEDEESMLSVRKQSMSSQSLIKRTWFLVSIIVLVGLIVSTSFWVLGMTSLRKETRLRLEHETFGITASVRTVWNIFKLTGLWIHQACNAPSSAVAETSRYEDVVACTRREFRGLYEYATSLDEALLSFRFISYVPNVTHFMRPVLEQEAAQFYDGQESLNYTGFRGFMLGEPTDRRDNIGPRTNSSFYFPLHYMEPLEGNEWLVDFDLLSSAFSGQIQSAVSQMSPIASGPITIQSPSSLSFSARKVDEKFILLIHPGVTVSVWNQTGGSLGVAAVGVGFSDIMQRVANSHTSAEGKALTVYIFDTTYPQHIQCFGGAQIHYHNLHFHMQHITVLPQEDYTTLLLKSQQKKTQDQILSSRLILDHFEWTIFVSYADHDDKGSNLVWERALIAVGSIMMFATCCCVAFWLHAKLRREIAIHQVIQASQAKTVALTIKHAESQAQMERDLNDYLAHEVRNPLAAAISACSFLSSSNEEQRIATSSTTAQDPSDVLDAVAAAADKNKEDIGVIQASLHFIDDLLRSMLDMHKAAKQQLKLVEAYTDIANDIFEPVRSMFLSHCFENFEFLISCPPQLIVWVDRMRLKQVVLNLAGNSRKFTCQGYIRLVARVVENSFVEIAVEDSGPGIPLNKRDRVFERFQESLDSLQQGTGMGLSLCKTLVNLMEGDIELDQSFDSGIPGFPGTRFVIRLRKQKPLDMDALDLDQAAQLHYQPVEGELYQIPTPLAIPRMYSVLCPDYDSSASSSIVELPKQLNILIVDDDMITRKMFCRLLARLEPSWVFEEAANGETALSLAEQKYYDVIFMDQYMASVEKQLLGTEAVFAFRSRRITSCICGLSADDLKHEFELSGANGFMRKPFPSNNKELEANLVRLFQRGGILVTMGGSSDRSSQTSSIPSTRLLRSQSSEYHGNSNSTSSHRPPIANYGKHKIAVINECPPRSSTALACDNDEVSNTAESSICINKVEPPMPPPTPVNNTTIKELPKNLNVLTVDDDKTLRKLIGRSLKRAEPTWTVDEASSGEAALDMVDQKSYDLIFMDQYMANVEKGLLGTETVRALRAKGIKSRICGLSANSLQEEFQESGANGFMRKPLPIRTEELVQHLAHLLNLDF